MVTTLGGVKRVISSLFETSAVVLGLILHSDNFRNIFNSLNGLAAENAVFNGYSFAVHKLTQAFKLKAGDELLNVERYDGDEFSTMLFVTKKAMCLSAAKANSATGYSPFSAPSQIFSILTPAAL